MTGKDTIVTGGVIIISAVVVFAFGARIAAAQAAIILLSVLVCATIGMVINSLWTLKNL